jgi:deoxyribonuclease-4
MHYHIGAHIKKESGSLLKTIQVIQQNDGNALQLFVSNPRSASIPNMQAYQQISEEIKSYCSDNGFKLVIHSSYTVNLAKEPKIGKKTLDLDDCYWVKLLIHELMVSEMIGSIGVVVHVGKYTSSSPQDGLTYMFAAMKHILSKMQEMQMKTKLILETPAGQGTELLTTVEEFYAFYNQFSTLDKKNLGICLDTAHIWSLGYDISEYYAAICKYNSAKDITVIHFNNSKREKASHIDMHETLLEKSGTIPLSNLATFLQKLKHKPMIILETPGDDLQKEIKWIKSVLHTD